MHKKNIPLGLLTLLQPYLTSENSHPLYKRVTDVPDVFIKFIDTDESSDFHFEIRSYESLKDSGFTLKIHFKPSNEADLVPKTLIINSTDLHHYLDRWINYLDRYASYKSPYEDNIVNQYEREILESIFIIEVEDHYSAYDLKTQLLIDRELDKIIHLLEAEKTKNNNAEIEYLQAEAHDIKKTQGRLTKEKVKKKMTTFLAKTRAFSFEIFKELIKELAKDFAKQLMKGEFNHFLH